MPALAVTERQYMLRQFQTVLIYFRRLVTAAIRKSVVGGYAREEEKVPSGMQFTELNYLRKLSLTDWVNTPTTIFKMTEAVRRLQQIHANMIPKDEIEGDLLTAIAGVLNKARAYNALNPTFRGQNIPDEVIMRWENIVKENAVALYRIYERGVRER